MSFTTNRSRFRRRFLLGSSVLTLVGFLAIGAQGCEPLGDIPEGECGNRIHEIENHEECDNVAEGNCGAPGTIGACRFICDYQDSLGVACAAGSGCGIDEICRKSDGLSDSPISIAGGGIPKLMSGDFDGDGLVDIVAVDSTTIDVHFLTTDGTVERTVSLPNEVGFPSIGDVNGDGRSDIVLTLDDRSVGVLLGQEDRSFAPQSHVAMFVAPRTRKLIPLGTYTNDSAILSFSDNLGSTTIEILALNERGGHERIPVAMAAIPGALEGAVATKGVFEGNIGCGAAAFEMDAPARVVVGTRCDNTEIKFTNYLFPPGFAPWAGVYLARADIDGFEYLFFGMTDGNPSLQVVKSKGNVDEPVEKLLDFEAGNCVESSPSLASVPLAIGDLNHDGYPDVVDSRGILLYTPNGAKRFTRLCHEYSFIDPMDMLGVQAAWTNAVIADFNGDGQQDLLASRKGQGVLDLWTWQSGGLNTSTIAVTGPIAELVSGDLDGDTIADAAFRLAKPPMPPTDDNDPDPLFAMFGNAFGLPSSPQVVGLVRNMQQLAVGRINGKNAAGQFDLLSDLVVLSASTAPAGSPPGSDIMPLTLVQGNPTRNLLSPLRIQENAALDLDESDMVRAVFVAKFGTSACPESTSDTAANIIAVGSSSIWLAGCQKDGSAISIDKDININDARLLFVPMDPEPLNASDPNGNEEPAANILATFINTPTYSNQMPPPENKLGLGHIEPLPDGKTFKPLLDALPQIDQNMRLPNLDYPDVPYAFADIDNNGLRDVILTAQEGMASRIYIFWNGDENAVSGPLSLDAKTEFDFVVSSNGPGNSSEIMDIAALNINDDRYKELAILTRNGVYFAELIFKPEHSPPLPKPNLGDRKLQLMSRSPITDIRGGLALLTIDANSDGVDDLVVADTGKLLLYVGMEQLP